MNFLDLFENNFKVVLPEIYMVLALSFLLMYGVIFSTSLKYNLPIITRGVAWLSIQTLFIALLLTLNNPIDHLVIFHGTLVHDYFTTIVKIFLLSAALCCIVASFTYLKRERLNAYEYLILLLIATLGMMLIVSSYDLISMYLAIEMQSLSLYVLAAFKKNSAFSTEAGLKYFILGAFASGLLLFGISIIYGFAGTTNFEDLHMLFALDTENQRAIQTGLIFISCAFLFKMAASPFHVWSPDVYDGAPLNSTIFFRGGSKNCFNCYLFETFRFLFRNSTRLLAVFSLFLCCCFRGYWIFFSTETTQSKTPFGL